MFVEILAGSTTAGRGFARPTPFYIASHTLLYKASASRCSGRDFKSLY